MTPKRDKFNLNENAVFLIYCSPVRNQPTNQVYIDIVQRLIRSFWNSIKMLLIKTMDQFLLRDATSPRMDPASFRPKLATSRANEILNSIFQSFSTSSRNKFASASLHIPPLVKDSSLAPIPSFSIPISR